MARPRSDVPPRIAVTLGDPRGIGPEVVAAALARPGMADLARWVVVGPEGVGLPDLPAERHPAGEWPSADGAAGGAAGPTGPEVAAGAASLAAVERAVSLALAGEVAGVVTAPISKRAAAAAGSRFPGHTELLRERTGVDEVTMIMAAERTVLGGPLRVALLTVHVPLARVPALLTASLVHARAKIAARALREWWGIPRPRLAFAGVNPHASEGGLFGDDEERVLAPAARRLEAEEEVRVEGIFPADTVFRRCLEGAVDLVVVPYHDVGLAVVKTVAREQGVNVTAGLPFPRTSPDHGTAFDIAGRGTADPGSMEAAMRLCAKFCRGGGAAGR